MLKKSNVRLMEVVMLMMPEMQDVMHGNKLKQEILSQNTSLCVCVCVCVCVCLAGRCKFDSVTGNYRSIASGALLLLCCCFTV